MDEIIPVLGTDLRILVCKSVDGLPIINQLTVQYTGSKNSENYDPRVRHSVVQKYLRGDYKEFGFWVLMQDSKPVIGAGMIRHSPDTVIGLHRLIKPHAHATPRMFALSTIGYYQHKSTSLRFWITAHGPNYRFMEIYQRLSRNLGDSELDRNALYMAQRLKEYSPSFMLNSVEQRIVEVTR